MGLAIFLSIIGTLCLVTAGAVAFLVFKMSNQLKVQSAITETNIDILQQLHAQQSGAEEEEGSIGFGT